MANLPPPLSPVRRNRVSDRTWLLLTLLVCALGFGTCVYRVSSFRTETPLTAAQANRSWRIRDRVPASASNVWLFTQVSCD